MIVNSLTKSILFKPLKLLFFLSSNLNKTYGSINKPNSQFAKNSKFTPDHRAIDQKSQSNEINSQKSNRQSSEQNDSDQSAKNKFGFDNKKNKQVAFFFELDETEQLNTIEEFRQNQMIKQLSIICKQMYFYRVQSDAVWKAIQNAFVYFLKPPYDQEKARSISQFLHGLAKSQRNTRSYAQEMIEVLPQTSIRSFTQIVVMIMRMGQHNEKFAQLVEDLYYKRKSEADFKQICLINYYLAKCGRKIDSTIADNVEQFKSREIALMLKAFDRSGGISAQLLKKCAQVIASSKPQGSVFDLRQLMAIYLKHKYYDNFHLLRYFQEQFRYLCSIHGIIHEDFIESIWPYFPEAINKNKLPPNLVEDMVKKLGQLRKGNKIRENRWRVIEKSFSKIENKDLREKLQKISELK